jgi:hypothetical protein
VTNAASSGRGGRRAIRRLGVVAVAPAVRRHLPTDRRRRPIERPRDLADAAAERQRARDVLPLREGEHARRAGPQPWRDTAGAANDEVHGAGALADRARDGVA